jgi:hypothetical protein
MIIKTQIFNKSDVGEFKSLSDVPFDLWNLPNLVSTLDQEHLLITANQGHRMDGWWLVPIITLSCGFLAAQRKFRYFPYSSPQIIGTSSLFHRYEITNLMISELQSKVHFIDLPFSPDYKMANSAIAQGCFGEWRHTYYIYKEKWERNKDSMLRNEVKGNIKYAASRTEIKHLLSDEDFNYHFSIRGTKESIEARKYAARRFIDLKCGFILAAYCKETGEKLGEVFLVKNKNTMLLYHSWYKKSSIRGIPSLLIYEAIQSSFKHADITTFDFEGSIIASVDKFMSSFGGEITPYSHIYWAKDSFLFDQLIHTSLNIEGRMTSSS